MFKKIPKTIKTIKLQEGNRKRNKIIALALLVIILLSITSQGVLAAKVDIESTSEQEAKTIYLFPQKTLDQYRSHENLQRDFLRTQIFADTYRLIEDYNKKSNKVLKYLLSLVSEEKNKDNDKNSKKAISYSNKWYSLYSDILYLDGQVEQTCFSSGNGKGLKWSNGSDVTNKDFTDMRSSITKCNNEMYSLLEKIKTTYDESNINIQNDTSKYVSANYKVLNWLWKKLGSVIKQFGKGNSSGNNILGVAWSTQSVKKIANTVAPVTKSFAYCIVVILFGVNMTNTMIQFDFTSPRGILKVFGSLLIAKIWVDVSVNVCIYILNIVNSMNSQILNLLTANGNGVVSLSNVWNAKPNTDPSWWDFIGAVISYFEGIIWKLPEIILCCVLCVSIIGVFIKIITRSFELTCLISVAPLAFSCLASEESKPYFKKFMGAFLSTCLFMTFIVICYAVGSQWIAEVNAAQSSTDIKSFFSNMISVIPRFIIIYGVCRIMRKPPKVLTNLID